MKKMGLAWGAVVAAVAYGAAVQAAPKAAGAGTAGATGAAGAGATAPSSGSMLPPAPLDPIPPSAPLAPSAPTAPAPDVQTPATAPAPDAEADAEAREEAREREAARKRVRRRRQLEAEAEAEADEEEAQARRRTEVERPKPHFHEWRLVAPHFLVSVERVTNVLGWTATDSVPAVDRNGFTTSSTVELESAGADVSFMGSGDPANPFSMPRVAFDGMFANGLTLGGSISYLVLSGEHQQQTVTNFNGDTRTVTVDDPTVAIFVFAPRIGVMIQAGPVLGVWLRGGISRLSAAREARAFDFQTGEQLTTTVTSTTTLVNATLDPQLVFTPVPHVGLSVGPVLDIGLSGSFERSDDAQKRDVKHSSYGVTGGLVAIF